jgi:hypothetical protein
MSQIKLKTEQIQKVNTQNKCKIVREQEDRLYVVMDNMVLLKS